MPTPCYISIQGQNQGNITAGAFTADSVGNVYVEGHEDQILRGWQHYFKLAMRKSSMQQ